MNGIAITQESVNRALYLLIIFGGAISMIAGLVIYFDTKTKNEMKRKRKKI